MANFVTIDAQTCKGCGLCVAACPKHVLELSLTVNGRGYHPSTVRHPNACIACAMCAIMCPDSAIRVEKDDD